MLVAAVSALVACGDPGNFTVLWDVTDCPAEPTSALVTVIDSFDGDSRQPTGVCSDGETGVVVEDVILPGNFLLFVEVRDGDGVLVGASQIGLAADVPVGARVELPIEFPPAMPPPPP